MSEDKKKVVKYLAYGPFCWSLKSSPSNARRKAADFGGVPVSQIGVYRLAPGADAWVDGLGRVLISYADDNTYPVHVSGPKLLQFGEIVGKSKDDD